MTQYVKKLPAVFQTVTEKKFMDATFDQVFSKKDSDLLSGFLGRRDPGSYNPITDFYLPEPSKNRTWWQLEATAYARDSDTTKTNIFFYEDLLDTIEYYGGNTLNQDRLFESEYYSFGPPIDYDMFINYQNYYWIEQGLPTIYITGVLGSDIIGQASYTTPALADPPNFTLSTGMTISLVDDLDYSEPHIVENFGGCIGIGLIEKFTDLTAGTIFEFLPWDGTIQLSTGRVIHNEYWDMSAWEVQAQPGNGDYITIERGALDRNAWSRTNKWFHIDTINAVIVQTGSSFPTNITRALRPIIQFVANILLYKSGTQFRETISFGFRDNIGGIPLTLSQFQGQQLTVINSVYGIEMVDQDLVCWFNDVATNNYIYVANLQGDGSVIFTEWTSVATPVLEGDIVFTVLDAPYDGAQQGQTWYYSGGVWQEAYNEKISTNQPPLFLLYDHNNIPLDDSATYPDNSFSGSKIFSYKVNTEAGATVDPVLKFPIVYTSLGLASDIIFQNNLITDRYTYTSALIPIDGYYYYNITTNPVIFNNWNLYDLCDCDSIVIPPPCNCIEVSKQRVIDKFVVGYGTLYQFRLSVTPYGYPACPDLIVSVNGVEVKNSSEQIDGYTFVEINNQIYVDLTTYLTTFLLVTQSQPPVVEAQTYTQDLLDPLNPGYFEIPQQLEANPTQLEISEISGSDLIQQFSSIISNQIGFTGVAFGGINNYRDSRKNRSVGSYILQNLAPALKSMLVSSSDDLSFINGVRFSSDEYTKFKNKFLSTALQLINQGFNPVQVYNNTVDISAWVGEILRILNVSKEFSNAFAYSFMAAQGTPFANESFTVPGNSLINLTNYIDLTDPKNVLYIYDLTVPTDQRILTVGVDYEIISTSVPISIQLDLGVGVKNLYVALYQNPLPTYIPSTPTKVGAYGAYVPRIELDATYAIPTNVIIGHDGSKTIAYGDYRDDLLLDLETRIYNFLQPKYRNEYYLPLRIESVKSGYFRETRYSRDEYLEITESYLNKWSAKNKANYRVNDWFTASLTTSVGQLWKLYNYRLAVTPVGAATDLPGNWKGIFQYYYDTYYPDTRPWEMLGLSEQPSWWQFEYGAPVLNLAGQDVWASTASGNNILYNDLEAGIIRQGASAIFDPETLTPQPQEMWARPGLSAIIPVDSSGEIIPIITLFGLAYTGNPYEPFDHFDDPWIYGDGGPVEQAWISTSGYRFSLQEFMYLMRPGPYGELLWDTLGTELSPGQLIVPGIVSPVISNKNWQYVQNDTFSYDDEFFAWFRPKNKDQIVHAEIVNGITEIRFGYQTWISDRILFLGKDIANTFGQKIRTLDVNLANKVAGFINKDTTNTYISSITPGATTNTLIIPSNNFEVFLHTSPVVETYSYSGIIIRALADGTFIVYGYDLLNAEFTTLDRTTKKLIDVSVGGTPAEFRYFEQGSTYMQGEYVRYNGIYYLSLATQTVQKFNDGSWDKLKALPTVGGISVTYKPISAETITKYPYGSILKTPQEVFDLMIGWGAYLESQGWQFTEVNQDTNILNDWLSSAKQFLFWLNTNWAPDASIQLSPLANSATLIVQRGYPNDVETLSNGVYSILDKFGVAIAPQNTTTDREGQLITVAPANLASGGIYYLQVNASETEHILIFDNETSFNDIIYSPLLRARQERLRFYGFRSNGWYGKMEAPGYLIIDNQLVPNYDTIVNAMRYYYDPDVTIDNPSLEDLGRHLIGYESKSYLDNLEVADDVQYLFYQGAIREKGTKQAFEKLFRSTKVQSNEIIKVYEEWALKLGDFGNTIEQVSTEFRLIPEQNTGEVIVARLNFVPSEVGFVKQINILNAQNTYINIPKLIFPFPDATPMGAWANWDPFEIYNVGSVVRYPDVYGNPVYYSSNIIQGPSPIFITANWTVILATRITRAFVILDNFNRISRIDIIDPGYGYLEAPTVTIDSGAEPHNLDRLYSVWQGEIIKDPAPDNIINIDIDETEIWVNRPTDPSVALEFPLTNNINYPLPNAGYVHFNDVTLSSFDADQTALIWGTSSFNPIGDNTLWIANTFAQDWDVYKLVDISSVSGFDVVTNADGQLFLRTDPAYLITPQFTGGTDDTDFGNLLSLYVFGAEAKVFGPSRTATGTSILYTSAAATSAISGGMVTTITLTDSGYGYTEIPNVTIQSPNFVQAVLTANLTSGAISSITINDAGDGYASGTISVSDPEKIHASANGILSGDTLSSIVVAEAGAGYVSPVLIVVSPPDLENARAEATISSGQILEIDIINAGTGYATVPSILIVGGGGGGATATATISLGRLATIEITNAGSSYTEAPTIVIDPPTGVAATATATVTGGTISSIAVSTPGSGYTNIPTIFIPAPTATTAIITPTITNGKITGYTIVDSGSGYASDPTLFVSAPNGTTATAIATITGNSVSTVNLTYSGSGYSFSPTITFDGVVNSGAIAGVTITDAGAGYLLAPGITVIGDGTGASLNANIVDGEVISVDVIDAGEGYTFATIVFDPPAPLSGEITEVIITKSGANYVSIPNVSILGDGAGATAEARIAGGVVSDIVITNPGSGYTVATVTIDPPSSVGADTNYLVAFEFNQIETDNDPSYNYYNLVTLDGNPISATDISVYADFTNLILFKTLRFLLADGLLVIPSYVSINDKIWSDGFDPLATIPPIWNVFTVITPTIQYPTGLVPFRTQEALINTSLFESASVFNATGTEIVQLPIYDPFKYILPGPAKQNLTYISLQDPARYNVTGNVALFNDTITFGEYQVGQLWWDLSSTRYVYYEQPIAEDGSETEIDNLIYRRNHWAQLFPGSVVAVYEWVKSDVPPAQYTGTGIPRDITSYVQITTSNRFTSISTTNYYFWVLGSTDKPNIENRTLAASSVTSLLQTPKSQGFAFFSPIQQTNTNNSYIFYNVQEILAYQGDNVQIQYRISERDDQEHTQWAFFREGDPNSLVTDQFWDKMVDSLCGYTKVLPVTEEFSNAIIVSNYLPWDIYGWDVAPWDDATLLTSPEYGEILPVPDPTLGEAEKYGITYRPRQGMFVKLQTARKIFVQSANELLKHIPIRDNNPTWDNGSDTDDFYNIYWTYTNWYEIGYENSVPTIIFETLVEANNALLAGDLTVGTILQVNEGTPDGRYILYAVVQLNPNIPALSLNEIGIENSAIKLLDAIYTDINKYGLSEELRELLNAFRTEVMIDAYIVDQNELFFSLLNYVISEQKNPNWVFKSSYIYIKEDNIPLTQSQLYIPDQIDNIVNYIIDVKPYHTQIRDYSTTYTISDITSGTASDSYDWNIILTFGPWDNLDEPFPYYILDAETFADNIQQFVSQEDVYTVPLTFFDISKQGYSQLFPYTFDFSSINLNDPQTFITPEEIVGVQIGNEILIAGQDFYAEYNIADDNYTIYFYNDPGSSPIPVALVWFDGNQLLNVNFAPYRNELAIGAADDDMAINIDTKLPVDISTGIPTPYVAYGDVWDVIGDPIAQILIDAGGQAEIPWDATLELELFPNTISSKENVNINDGPNYYRNATEYAGELVYDLPAPDSDTYNLSVITVYVDPITHPSGTDILPDPTSSIPGVIWIEGERIEYKNKVLMAVDTWELRLVRRGTMGTAATEHLALVPEVDEINAGPDGETILVDPLVYVPNQVFVEASNELPASPNTDIWNVYSLPGVPDILTQQSLTAYTSVTNVPIGGLWYARTPESDFLIDSEGKSIP